MPSHTPRPPSNGRMTKARSTTPTSFRKGIAASPSRLFRLLSTHPPRNARQPWRRQPWRGRRQPGPRQARRWHRLSRHVLLPQIRRQRDGQRRCLMPIPTAIPGYVCTRRVLNASGPTGRQGAPPALKPSATAHRLMRLPVDAGCTCLNRGRQGSETRGLRGGRWAHGLLATAAAGCHTPRRDRCGQPSPGFPASRRTTKEEPS